MLTSNCGYFPGSLSLSLDPLMYHILAACLFVPSLALFTRFRPAAPTPCPQCVVTPFPGCVSDSECSTTNPCQEAYCNKGVAPAVCDTRPKANNSPCPGFDSTCTTVRS